MSGSVLAAIPYTTFPEIHLGPLTLRTFGLMVGLGVLVGAWIAARVAQHEWGLPREDTYRLATRMVVAGVIGARLTWDITHWDQIENPLDLIAVWEGGLQFSGGFIAAVAVGVPTIRKWRRHVRWGVADSYLYGLTAGLAIGRIGCYSVGEHFGGESNFFLANRYDGGEVREPNLGDVPLLPGTTFHNTSLYEFIHLVVLFVVLTVLRRRGVSTGTLVGVFCGWYGIARFVTDFLRVNDDKVLGLTGAQWLSVLLIGAAAWVFLTVRPALAAEGRPSITECWPERAPSEPAEAESDDVEEAAADEAAVEEVEAEEVEAEEVEADDPVADDPEAAEAEETNRADSS
ncbi:MAG: prolipoprotein diacylglyceryl transferase [Acidimicrobiales bacterium]